MLVYKSVSNQNIYDVCLSTYGSINYINKLMSENGILSINDVIPVGREFLWDEALVSNPSANQKFLNNNIILATGITKKTETGVITDDAPSDGDLYGRKNDAWAKVPVADLDPFELLANKITAWSAIPSDEKYPSEKLVKDTIDATPFLTLSITQLSTAGTIAIPANTWVKDILVFVISGNPIINIPAISSGDMNGQEFYPNSAGLHFTSAGNLDVNISGGTIKIQVIKYNI